jgi:hypothetical protein
MRAVNGRRISVAKLLILFAWFLAAKAGAQSFSTNGYRLTVLAPRPLCTVALSPSAEAERTGLVKRVLTSWFSRGDYRAESLEALEKLEAELDPKRTTWIEYASGDRRAAVRMYDGTKNAASVETRLTPTERKFPGIEVRRHTEQPIIEVGLLDVEHGVGDGVDALFHQVAKILKRDYLDAHARKGKYGGELEPTVIAIARPANVRLYQWRYGLLPYLKADGTPLKTANGMDVLEMPVAQLVARYYGKRIYPRTRGEPDYWAAFWKSQHARADEVRGYASSVSRHIRDLQGDGSIVFKPRLSTGVNASLKLGEWHELIDRAVEILPEENFPEFERRLQRARREIWSWEPVVEQEGSYPVRMGSGFFSFTYQVEYKQWKLRRETVEYIAFAD